MNTFKEKYINPFTDYGFKRLFGEEPNKDLLLDFLNELLKESEGEIKEISYMPDEKLPVSKGDRKAIFDLYCTNERGEKFIVELRNVYLRAILDKEEFKAYQESFNAYRDIKNSVDTAWEEGKIEAIKTNKPNRLKKPQIPKYYCSN